MHQWTDQQETIFSTIEEHTTQPTDSIITIDSVAGSSKSSSMVEAVKRIYQANPSISVRYLVFGTLAAQEARTEFGTTAIVSTLHSLAFLYEVTNSNPKRYLPNKRSYISWQDIPKYVKRPFGIDFQAIQLVDAYCSSEFTDLALYILDQQDNLGIRFSTSVIKLTKTLLDLMYLGKMPCTHAFYLKIFHINLVNGLIQLPYTDILAVDEAQDLTAITTAIIDHFPAKLKILVGDEKQAIFKWMGCVSAFDLYPNATKLKLTKSFRVNALDAKRVQYFMRHYVDSSFEFTGNSTLPPMPSDPTVSYLTRTNGALISKMVELDNANIPYHLATKGKIDQMFKLPLDIAHTKPGPELPHNNPLYDIQHSVNEWAYSQHLQKEYANKYSYLLYVNRDNPEVYNAIQLLLNHSYDTLKETADNAKAHTKSTAKLRLMTVHTSKGTTSDIVELADDVDESIRKLVAILDAVPNHPLKPEELESLYVYYVAITRHKYELRNANLLL